MLKGRNGLVLTVLLNIVIWSFFAYRLYSAFHEEEGPETMTMSLPKLKSEIVDTIAYHLSLDYEDPFLKKEIPFKGSLNSSSPPITKTVESKPKKIEKELLKLPEIKYLGLVKNSTSGFATAFVSVNGQSRLVKANETLEGVVIKNFDARELVVMFGKEKIVVKK